MDYFIRSFYSSPIDDGCVTSLNSDRTFDKVFKRSRDSHHVLIDDLFFSADSLRIADFLPAQKFYYVAFAKPESSIKFIKFIDSAVISSNYGTLIKMLQLLECSEVSVLVCHKASGQYIDAHGVVLPKQGNTLPNDVYISSLAKEVWLRKKHEEHGVLVKNYKPYANKPPKTYDEDKMSQTVIEFEGKQLDELSFVKNLISRQYFFRYERGLCFAYSPQWLEKICVSSDVFAYGYLNR